MKKSVNYSKAFELINALSQEEKDAFIQEIMNKLGKAETHEQEHDSFTGSRCDSIVAEMSPQRPDCPHCGAKASLGFIAKKGNHKGAQRYLCKSCGAKFVSTTNTAFSRTRKSAETWRKFIEMTLSQKSLAECAAECDICVQTAFTWRHKILNVFAVNQDSVKMTGRIEMDDMFISVSYKGNHVGGSFGVRSRANGEANGLPRKSYRRGSDNRDGIRSKACVMCMVQDKNKAFYAAVPGVGPADSKMLEATIGKHVQKESAHIYSDTSQNNIRFFESNNYRYRAFAANVSENKNEHKPEVDGDAHIQNVNNFHSRLRKFLRAYCGVSTKYLGNYVVLFAWLDNVKASKQRNSVKNVSTARAAACDCYISRKEICARPAVPSCSAA